MLLLCPTSLLSALGHLYVEGVAIDWAEYDKPYNRQKVLMPTYPFQRERYWVEPNNSVIRPRHHTDSLHQLLQRRLDMALDDQIIYEAVLSYDNPGFVKDHMVYGQMVVPGASYMSSVATIFDELEGYGVGPVELVYIRCCYGAQAQVTSL